MLRPIPLVAALFLSALADAQTSDLVLFTDDGVKFTLVVDGDVKNEKPAARVVATGIRNETPMVLVRFEDLSIPEVRKQGYFPLGKEYTVMVTTNKKGEKVFRPTGEAALGTAAGALVIDEKPRPVGFQDDEPTSVTNPGGSTGTTVVITEQTSTTAPGTGENVNMTVGFNGLGVNMNVNVNDPVLGTSATSTTTTTTTTTTTIITDIDEPVQTTATRPAEPPVYTMPGYTGRVGCPWPMSSGEFADAKSSISSKSFEDTRMSVAKQVATDRCFTVDQVKGIMELFSFEETKLDFAKFAYDHTFDLSNYFKLNDAFTFESSVDELNAYIRGR
ncbi:MAG TPA: DUF4476 domain-containing protein [Flavobacteriales bacterium]|nr:DUF4476 domain-containing protein [Flavobacteriales bacterium]HQW85806.1 DUF4476 domain-containing protein [Flavobacteriales bacterium]